MQEAHEKLGGEPEDHFKNVSMFDPEIVELLRTDDSVHFWYTFGIQLAEEEELGPEIGMVLAHRTLWEFIGLSSDEVINLGEQRHKEGREKLLKGNRDRNVKVQCAAILAAQSISRIRGVSNIAHELYQHYVCRFPPYLPSLDEQIKKYDLLIEEHFS